MDAIVLPFQLPARRFGAFASFAILKAVQPGRACARQFDGSTAVKAAGFKARPAS
jgi:hypothetical protein